MNVDVESSHEQMLADISCATTYVSRNIGVRIGNPPVDLAVAALSSLPHSFPDIAIVSGLFLESADIRRLLWAQKRNVWVEVTSIAAAQEAVRAGASGVIAKGNEAGGWVGEETTFVLLQRMMSELDVPVLAYGGIGMHSAASCYAAGAAGVVLDLQLALTKESVLPDAVKAAIARMDGSETVAIPVRAGQQCRVYARSRAAALGTVMPGWNDADSEWPIGQDASFAAQFSKQFHTVGAVVTAMTASVKRHIALAMDFEPLAEASPLAVSHGTRYPIVQGAMTRVSDRSAFALAVAEGGALPFLALAQMRAPEVRELLQSTRGSLGDRPWGVGILGFVPPELREEQLGVVREYRPRFVLIAGGRPDQAQSLEAEGIATYLHVPSPELLRMFLHEGARRFVFEGRECGGHVGPRSSFVLWDSMVDVLLEFSAGATSDCHILLAGGIHDGRSAAMAAALASPLAARGMRIGVLAGTAYLFTREAVESGAIVADFQKASLECSETVLLEVSPGHAIRCFPNEFVNEFEREKQRLNADARSRDEVREALEMLNLGRLRIASKAVRRADDNSLSGSEREFVQVDEREARREGMYMLGQVAAMREGVTTIAALHSSISVDGTRLLADAGRTVVEPVRPRAQRGDQVAIIGMSCILPKAPNLESYWQNILDKVSAITEVPASRWDWRVYFDESRDARDRIYSRWGGFVDPIQFDPLDFGMPPNSLASTDPLQLLALKATRDAIADAGYADRAIDRSRASVIIATSGGIGELGTLYGIRSTLPLLFGESADDIIARSGAALPEWTEDSFPGMLPNVIAGRIANRFNFTGTNFAVDAACGSSLAAVHLAVRELQARTSDVVIVGGVDNTNGPFGYLSFSKTHALSPTGACRTFDATADGIAISEGLVMLVLKRLDDAERDGDRIYTVVRGVGASGDGKAKGLTAPRPEGQTAALERAYDAAGISPASVALFEAHGTGTVVGDRTEASTLGLFLESEGASPKSAAIGSVKSIIGHTKAAAGMAGIAKAALSLYRKVLPPTLGVTSPNKEAGFGNGPLYVSAETRPWIHSGRDHPRRAGVSAFGFGGTNFHAVLEEYAGDLSASASGNDQWPAELFFWSETSREQLVAALSSLNRSLVSGAKPSLRDLSLTVCIDAVAKRARGNAEIAIVATSLTDVELKIRDVIKALAAAEPIGPRKGIYHALSPLRHEGSLAFLFPGQGSQYPGMMRDICTHFSSVREALERADEALSSRIPEGLSRFIYPPPAFTTEAEDAARRSLTATQIAQPALGAIEVGLLSLLRDLGIEPELAAGHSYGEYVALHAAGVMDEVNLFELSEARGRIIAESAGENPGTMTAARAGYEAVSRAIDGVEGVWIANFNAPEQTILAGTRDGIARAQHALESAGIGVKELNVSCAFHSPLVAEARAAFADELSTVDLFPARFSVYSNAVAEPHPASEEGMRDLLGRHIVMPVRFQEEIEAMYEAGARVFVEVGPRNVLTGLTRQILGSRPHLALAIDAPGAAGIPGLLDVVAQLATHGFDVDLPRLFVGRNAERLDLSKLTELTSARLPSATTWMVDCAHAWPVAKPIPAVASAPLASWAAAAEAVANSGNLSGALSRPPVRRETLDALGSFDAASIRAAEAIQTAATAGDATDALVEFQRVMARALEVQESVMLAYLGRDRISAEPIKVQAAGAPAIHQREPRAAPAIVEKPQPIIDSQPTEQQLLDRLIRLVSERTGYPAESLGLDVDLEGDLGIDSIKRTEIVGALRKSIANGGGSSSRTMDQLTRAKTLRAIAEALSGALAAAAENVVHDVSSRTVKTALAASEPALVVTVPKHVTAGPVLARSALAFVRRPLEAIGAVPKDGVFIVTDDQRGIADAVAKEIIARGGAAIIVRDIDARDAAEAEMRPARASHGRVAGIIHLAPLRLPLSAGMDSASEYSARLDRETKWLFRLIKSCADDLKSHEPARVTRVISAAVMGGRQGIDSSKSDQRRGDFFPGSGGLAGLLKTAAAEWTDVGFKAIDVGRETSADQIAKNVLAELCSRSDEVEVGYFGGNRFSIEHVSLESLPRTDDHSTRETDTPTLLSKESVVLATGGAAGITAEILLDLARIAGGGTLIVTGRSPEPAPDELSDTGGLVNPAAIKSALMTRVRTRGEPPPLSLVEKAYRGLMHEREVRRNLVRLRSSGARVMYVQSDASDAEAVLRVVDDIYAQFGRLDGVIHAAGRIDDHLLEDKTTDSFDSVFDVKANGAFALAKALEKRQPGFLAFFSSTAAAFGNRGQCDYSAANEVLNRLASYLDARWSSRVVSIGWGAWSGAGMVSHELERQLAEQGRALIDVRSGVAAFKRELAYGEKGDAQVLVTGEREHAAGLSPAPVETAHNSRAESSAPAPGA